MLLSRCFCLISVYKCHEANRYIPATELSVNRCVVTTDLPSVSQISCKTDATYLRSSEGTIFELRTWPFSFNTVNKLALIWTCRQQKMFRLWSLMFEKLAYPFSIFVGVSRQIFHYFISVIYSQNFTSIFLQIQHLILHQKFHFVVCHEVQALQKRCSSLH